MFAARYGHHIDVEDLVDISARATRTGNRRLKGSVRFHLLQTARHRGDLELLGQVADEIVAEPADSDDRRFLVGSAAYHLLTIGRVDDAERVVRASLEDRSPLVTSSAHQVLATVAYHREDRGALASAHDTLARIAEGAPFMRPSVGYAATLLAVHDGTDAPSIEPSALPAGLHHRGLEALVHAVSDRPGAALALFAPPDVAPHSLDGITRSSLLPLVHRRLGELRAAAAVLSEVIAGRQDRIDIAWADILGELAALLVEHGEPGDAARVLGIRERFTAETGIRIGWIPSRFHEEPRRRIADALRADGVSASSAEGRSLPPPAAMAVVLSLVDDLVATTSKRARPPFGWDSLTVAERRVVDLVAAGRTNREAAESLGIKTSTVHTHLLRVYAKLGIGSRAELASAHVREQLGRAREG